MKKIIVFMFAVVLLATGGCGGHRRAVLDPGQQVKYNDTNISFFERPIDPTELARSKAIIVDAESKAKFDEALAKQIAQGNAATVAGQFIGCFINEDPFKTAIIQHPTMAQQIVIKPNKHEFIVATQIPKYITIRFTGDERNRSYRVHQKSGIYNGVKIDFGARVDSQNYNY